MRAVSSPSAHSQNIESSRREKCLKPELFAANGARLPHLTGTYGLRNRPFNACSFGVQRPNCGRVLAFACLLQGGRRLFIWTQKQPFRSSLGASRA
jgi:hypothetical protein